MTNILQKNWLIARLIENKIKTSVPLAKGKMLDAGCGSRPYRKFFQKSVAQYYGMDIPYSPLINDTLDLVGSVVMLPFKEEALDFVLCTEVLQYTPEPRETMKELSRILNGKGMLVLTTTQMWHVTNSPYDCYRFTRHGLDFLAESAGLKIRQMEALGGFWLRMGLKFCYSCHRIGNRSGLMLLVSLFLVLPQLFFLVMDRIFFDPKDVIMHFLVAEKD